MKIINMKTLLLLLLPTFFFAQNSFKKLDSLSFKNQVINLLNETGKKYEYYSFAKENGTKIIRYRNVNDVTDIVNVFYYTYMEGEDKNLEIKGVESWDFRSITGNYLSLFPIWQKFADKDADKEKLSKSRHKIKGNYSFNELEAPYWMMRF